MTKSSQAKPIIEIRHLKKTYWNDKVAIPALRGIDLTINEGEFIAIMGHSGSGKSTLMNVLAFLDGPSSGTYHFAGEDIKTFDENYLATLRNATIGFVFQQYHLLSRTTALDNVCLPMMYAGVRKRVQKKRAYEALEKVGLTERIYHKPNQLSGGQQQRVSIARALVNNPMLIFCDEPTGNLDSTTTEEIMEIFKGLHSEGKTIIMVTHEKYLSSYAERVIQLKDGKII